MKTDDFVALLARTAGPVAPNVPRRRFTAALGWGMFGTMLAMAVSLGVRSDLAEVVLLPMFWLKIAFPSAVAVATCYLAVRLALPGARLGRAPGTTIAALFAAVWLLAIAALLSAAPAERSHLVFGTTWLECLVSIPLLSLPVFAAVVWAMKGLAPTRLSLAGGAAGLLAGAVGAAVYALHCPELEAPFIAIWYVLGMLVPAIGGALIGPHLLRW